jgi:hypothetical protein
MVHTLGIDRHRPILRRLTAALVALIVLGNLSMPLAIWLGIAPSGVTAVPR